MKNILLLEDDRILSQQLADAILNEEMEVTPIYRWSEMADRLEEGSAPPVVVLDRLVGDIDTKLKLADIRSRWPHSSVLVISAINTPMERAELINEGADDYLGKPFLTEEFLARVKALLRRTPEQQPTLRKIGNADLDMTHRRLMVAGNTESLPAKEFHVLSVLSLRPGQVFNRYELLERVWGNVNYAQTNVVEVTLNNLRRRLESLGCDFRIRNQRNVGYWIES